MKIILSAIVLLLAGCQSAEKLTHKALAKDKVKVIEIVRAIYPCITTDSTQAIVVIKAPDSSAFFKSVADSLALIKRGYKDSIAIRYKDSCKSVQDNFDQGFNLGYEIGKNDGKQQVRTDTMVITNVYRIKDMGEVDICNALKEEAIRDGKTYKKAARVFAILSGLLALVAFIIFKVKRK